VFERARRLAASSVAALGRRTVSGMLCAGGEQFGDWTAAYRMFGRGRIDGEALFAPMLGAVMERLGEGEPLTVMMDDTLLRKRGRKVHGAKWRRDPLGPRFHTNYVWAQRFLQVSAALPDAGGAGRARGIPVDFVHAPSPGKPRKGAAPEAWEEYRRLTGQSRLGLVAADRLRRLRRQAGGRAVVCSVDGGFTNRTLLRDIPDGTAVVGRIRKDARLYAPPEAEARRRGRARLYGSPLPTPEQVRQDDATPWRQVEAYAAGRRHRFDVKHLPAVRWKGCGGRTVQVVVIRPLAYRPRKGARLLYRNPAYLVCTDVALPLDRVVQSYVWRWEIEVNFRDEKTVMGAGQAQVRTPESVQSVPLLVVAAYSCLLLAGTASGTTPLPRPRWQRPREGERTTTLMLQNLFRAHLWKIALDSNKTRFASKVSREPPAFYSSNPLHHAVCYAYK
jgi:hypothetical protein